MIWIFCRKEFLHGVISVRLVSEILLQNLNQLNSAVEMILHLRLKLINLQKPEVFISRRCLAL